jgi:U3 small nucleolar RNA-associated protein 13
MKKSFKNQNQESGAKFIQRKKKPNKNKHISDKEFNIKYQKTNKEEDMNVEFQKEKNDTMDNSVEQLKVGKDWKSEEILEMKNTTGTILINEDKGIMFSIVEDSLRILDINTLKTLKIIRQPEEQIMAFTYNTFRDEIICSMNNSLMRVYDISSETPKCVKIWKLNRINCKVIKIDPSGKFYAMIATDNTILIYDANSYALITIFGGHSGFIYNILFNPIPDKFILYSSSEDGTIKIWDIILNKQIASLEEHSAAVRHIQLTNDGSSLISISIDNKVVIWKLSTNKPIKIFNYNKGIDYVIYFTRVQNIENEYENITSQHNKNLMPTLLFGCEDGCLEEINLNKGANISTNSKNLINRLQLTKQGFTQVIYSQKNTRLYCLTLEQLIIFIDIDLVNQDISQGKLAKLYPGYCQEVLDVKFLPNSTSFLFASNDNSLKLYDNSRKLVQIFEGHKDFIMNIDIKHEYIATSSKDNMIRIWKYQFIEDQFTCNCIAILKGHSEAVNSSTLILKKGRMLVSGSKDRTLKLWDFSNYNQEEVLHLKQSSHSTLAHEDEVNLVKVAPNEKLIASASYDKTIKVIKYLIFSCGILA